MLVLTRGTNEEIRIGHDIVVRVLEVKGDRVRIGIAAPPSVPVHRQEVYLEIERANREALEVIGSGLKGAEQLLKEDQNQEVGRKSHKMGRQSRKGLKTEVNHGT